MRHLRILAISAAVSLAGCTAQQRQILSTARDETTPAPGTFEFAATCETLTVTVDGYPAGTVFYLTADGEPPLHLRSDTIPSSTHTFERYVHDYGIYIRTPDGTVVADTHSVNPSECPEQ